MLYLSLASYSLSLCISPPDVNYHPPIFCLYTPSSLFYWFHPLRLLRPLKPSLACTVSWYAMPSPTQLYPQLLQLWVDTHKCPGTRFQPLPLSTFVILSLAILSPTNKWQVKSPLWGFPFFFVFLSQQMKERWCQYSWPSIEVLT